MAYDRPTYKPLASCKVSKSKSLVISECSKGGYTLAQQIEVNDDGHVERVFLKGAAHITDYKTLVAFRDCIDRAIDSTKPSSEESEIDKVDWDN